MKVDYRHACFFPGTIYVVGGNDGTTALNSTEILDRKSCSWVLGPMLSVPRGNCGVCVLENKLFAVGGFNGKKFLDTLEYLDTEHSDEWCTYLPVEYYKKSSHIQDALSADHEKSKNKIGQLINGNKEDDEKEDGSQQELSNRPDLLPVMPLKAGTNAVACNGVGNGHGESTERNS